MRPILRGDIPNDENGDPIVFTDHKQARDHLIERLGDYCSYCEIKINTQVDVEHVVPKTPVPALRLEWSNFLLACGNCNSIKGDKTFAEMTEVYWPDRDNTLRAFVYEQDEPPQVADDPAVDADIAFETLELTGLDRVPGHPNFSDRDRRWSKRMNAWGNALLAANLISSADTDEMRQLAIVVAKETGFWSVWYEVFFDDEDMCQRLIDINTFSGTAQDCFDNDSNVVPRPGGQI